MQHVLNFGINASDETVPCKIDADDNLYVKDVSGNASLASISGIHIGGGGVVSTTGSSQTIIVPSGAKSIVFMPEGGKVYVAVDDGNASTTSHIYVSDESSMPWPVTSASVVKVYVVAGVLHYEFLG